VSFFNRRVVFSVGKANHVPAHYTELIRPLAGTMGSTDVIMLLTFHQYNDIHILSK
jgi:hypothetical protein